jgi:hypothetical protein
MKLIKSREPAPILISHYLQWLTGGRGLRFNQSQGGCDVEFKICGSNCRYNDAALDELRSLSSRPRKCCQVLCGIGRGDGHRTPRLLIFVASCVSRAHQSSCWRWRRRTLLQITPLVVLSFFGRTGASLARLDTPAQTKVNSLPPVRQALTVP